MARFWTLILCAFSITLAEVIPRDNTATYIHQLSSKLSPEAIVLSNPSDQLFQQKLERWTDLDKQTPAAIVLVATEQDIFETVKLAKQYRVPFVTAAGGHGNKGWSTIGRDGVIIDVTNMTAISIDTKAMTATVEPGVLTEQLVAALAEKNIFYAQAGANDVSVIGQASMGGLSQYSSITSVTSDTIISVRIVTGTGELLTVSASENSDLFYGIRGAAVYFGLVTQMTLKVFPVSLLGATGDDVGTIWAATAIFPVSQVAEVIAAHATFVNNRTAPQAGLTIFQVDPTSGEPLIIAGLNYYGSTAAAQAHYAEIIKLNASSYSESRVPLVHVNDGVDPYDVKGDLKYFELAGTQTLQSNPNAWKDLANTLVELIKKAPDARNTSWAMDWGECLSPGGNPPNTAWSHRDVSTWLECLSWWTDPKTTQLALSSTKQAIQDVTRGFDKVEYYQAFDRSSPLIDRFGDLDRIATLTCLKYRYDPEGLFTDIFLL